MDTLQPEISNFDQSFINSGLISYNIFVEEIAQFVAQALNDPTNDIINMRIAIEDGLRNVTKWFKQTLIAQGQKVHEDYQRTIEMVQEGDQAIEQAFKKVLINQSQIYQKLLGQ